VRRSTVILLGVLIGLTGSLKVFGASNNTPMKSLQQAAMDGDVEQLKAHLAKGSDFNKADQYGYTPLKRLIEGHKSDAAKLIIDSGKVDINAKDRDGRTPLLLASVNAEKEIVDALLAKGADIKAKDKDGRTALHAAIQMTQTEIATVLIEKGADVNATDSSGMTPLLLAQQRSPDLVDLLKKNGAKEPVNNQLSPYGNYAYGGGPGAPQAPGAAPAPARAAIQIDPNAIQQQVKQFEGLAAALKTVDTKGDGEQQAWIQRRTDNRTALLSAVERQFAEELAFVKPIATEEKAQKTAKAIDDLTAKRKKRTDAVSEQLREQRRTAPATSTTSGTMNTGRSNMRGGRGRTAGTGAGGSAGYSQAAGPYGNPNAKMPQRRGPADANQPALDQDTQRLIQAWLSTRPEDKKALLTAVHEMNVADLDDLRQLATEEQAKKTAAVLSGLMLARQERVQKITTKWQEDDARQQKLQERYGPQGASGRGMQGTQQQQGQQGMRGGRRGR